MTYKNKIFSIILMSLVSISMTHAANVILKDGSSYQGEIKSQNSETLVMDVNGIEMRIPTTSVSTIDLQGTPVQTTPAAKTTTATAPSTTITDSKSPVTVSAGTSLTVRMMESIN
jgi:hypothetical protein